MRTIPSANGFFNRMDKELGADGPNMWDYEDNAILGAEYLNAFTSNCMDAQEP